MRLVGFIVRRNFVGCFYIMGMIDAQKIDAVILLASCQQNLYVLLCVQWKTPDDGQRNCLKHVEFYSKNKFEKLVHPVGFIIRSYIVVYLFFKLKE